MGWARRLQAQGRADPIKGGPPDNRFAALHSHPSVTYRRLETLGIRDTGVMRHPARAWSGASLAVVRGADGYQTHDQCSVSGGRSQVNGGRRSPTAQPCLRLRRWSLFF